MESKLPCCWHGNFGTFSAELCKHRSREQVFLMLAAWCVTDAIGNLLLFPANQSVLIYENGGRVLADFGRARDEKRERNETSDFDISGDKKVLLEKCEGGGTEREKAAADKGEEDY